MPGDLKVLKLLGKLTEPWGLMRIVRLGLSVWLLKDAFAQGSWFLGLFAAFFLYQAVYNVKCMPCEVMGTCDVDTDSKNQLKDSEVTYETIK